MRNYPQLTKRLLYLQDYKDDVSTLFILEAPFDKELIDNCPCVGDTGVSMSKALFNPDIKISLGNILNGKVESIPTNANNYAIFDTFKFPIDPAVAEKLDILLDNLWSMENLQWSKIKELDRKIGRKLKRKQVETGCYDRLCHYKTLIQHIQKIDSNVLEEFIDDYKKELWQATIKFKNLKNIIVCGFIAQSIFCFAYGLPYCVMPYRRNCITSREKIIRFVEHPINAHHREYRPLWQYETNTSTPFILNTDIRC